MLGTKVFIILLASVPIAFAQRGGGFAGGAGRVSGSAIARPGPVRPAGSTGAPGLNRGPFRGGPTVEVRRGYGHHFGYGTGYFWPYFPIWDYGSMPPDGSAVGEEYLPEEDLAAIPPGAAGGVMMQPYPTRPVSSVIHEYRFDDETPVISENQPSFTIVLTDGSTRSAVASWVQGGKLHYMDLQSRSQVLAADVIDRSATVRANASKNLRLELPPA